MNTPDFRKQRGFTLVVGLIMLMMMTLFAVTTFNLGKGSLQIVDNMQQRNQAQTAAQEALDNVISHTLFTTNPTNIFDSTNCPTGTTVTNGMCVDINGDGKTIETVALTPTPSCIESKTIKTGALDPSKSSDAACLVGSNQQFGISGAAGTGDSLCADTVWNLTAVASESTSSAQVALTEGVSVRTSTDSAGTYCP